MVPACDDRNDIAGCNLYGLAETIIEGSVAQLTFIPVAHSPQAAVAFEKQAMPAARCNSRHRLRCADEHGKQLNAEQVDGDEFDFGVQRGEVIR